VPKGVILSAAREYRQNFCDRLTSQSRLSAVWNMAKKMIGMKFNPTLTSLIDNGNIVEFNKDKADVCSLEHLPASAAQQITALSFRDTKTTSSRTTLICSQTTLQSEKRRNISTTEFAQPELNVATQQLKKSSAPGEDQITYECFQQITATG